MTKAELIDNIKNRLYLLSSQAAPSYQNDSLYPFMDRAYHIVIERTADLSLLSPIIKSHTFNYKNLSFSDKELAYVLDLPKRFFIFISGIAYITRNNNRKSVELEKIDPKFITKFIPTGENKLYFTNPKVAIKNERSQIVIVPDGFSEFDLNSIPQTLGFFDYIEYPKKFEDIRDSDEPEVLEPLHLDIAEKAAELGKKILDSGTAIQEVQADDLIKMS